MRLPTGRSSSPSVPRVLVTEAGGLVDAPGRGLLGVEGDSPFRILYPLGRTSDVRTLAYRIPMTFPAWDVARGVIVSGPPLPDRRRTYARPAATATEIGPASLLSHDELQAAQRARDVAQIDACNRFELELLERVTRHYLDAGTELVIAFTGIPDGLHHAFWAFHDPGSPVHEPGAPAALRTIIERWYAEIDSAIGRLSAACDERTAVIVSLRRLAGW